MTIVASAPGKVLLSGGYLILEDDNVGIVIAVNAKFHCEIIMESEVTETTTIQVHSPQLQTTWTYHYDMDSHSLTTTTNDDEIKNPYIEESLRIALLFLTTPMKLDITLRGDSQFYGEGRKTGLGSSACLVTSLTAALCRLLNSNDDDDAEPLAQMAHALAQDKIGSGFDVSAAVHGSHLYQKAFTKEALQKVIQSPTKETVQATIAAWRKDTITRFQLPDDWQISMADVAGGSESPSMARAVLEWKKNSDGSLWQALKQTNQRIVDMFKDLSIVNRDDLRKEFLTLRKYYKQMGDEAGVPIEPDEQTALADKTMEIPGVIVALVPGAGGHDALCCLHLKSAEEQVHDLWNSLPNVTILPIEALVGQGLTITS